MTVYSGNVEVNTRALSFNSGFTDKELKVYGHANNEFTISVGTNSNPYNADTNPGGVAPTMSFGSRPGVSQVDGAWSISWDNLLVFNREFRICKDFSANTFNAKITKDGVINTRQGVVIGTPDTTLVSNTFIDTFQIAGSGAKSRSNYDPNLLQLGRYTCSALVALAIPINQVTNRRRLCCL